MPEHIRTTNCFEQYVKKHLRLAASGYHYDIRDLISAQTMSADDIIQFVNVDSVQTNGVEGEPEVNGSRF